MYLFISINSLLNHSIENIYIAYCIVAGDMKLYPYFISDFIC